MPSETVKDINASMDAWVDYEFIQCFFPTSLGKHVSVEACFTARRAVL